jgi:hypothetical protein
MVHDLKKTKYTHCEKFGEIERHTSQQWGELSVPREESILGLAFDDN